ncbi:MAG: hypothetical protein ACE5HG_01970 [Candidatus Bathyarchaeia archaeon]
MVLRIYSDTKPHNSHIADLQKGLILIHKGAETVGEGTGFGVPVLLYSDETYFSGSSHVCISRQNDLEIIRKEFFMDKVPRKRIRKVGLENQKLRAILRSLAEVYQKHRHLRILTLASLPRSMGVHTSFVKTVPAGKVIVTYGLSQGRIRVKTDFNLLKRENLQKIFVLNEQGSRFFRRYSDSKGTNLVDKQIGAWETIEAEWARITDLQGRVGFRLWKAKNSVLRRGREFLKDGRDWIGLDYEVNPESAVFEYEIEILGA